MQQTNFRFVAIVHDDASTDNSAEIISEYAKNYPNIIFPIYESENQYKQGKCSQIIYEKTRELNPKYLATCEGDDYWTDPLKLQKQVDFMDEHPEYSVCFHNHRLLWDGDDKPLENLVINVPDGIVTDEWDITPEMYFKNCSYCQPLTELIRLSMFDWNWPNLFVEYRDTHENYLLLKTGKGRFLNFDGGVYRKQPEGVSSGISRIESCKVERRHFGQLYSYNKKDKELRDYLISVWLWNYALYTQGDSRKEFWQSFFGELKNTPDVAYTVLQMILKRKLKGLIK